MAAQVTQHDCMAIHGQMPGARFWWIDSDARLQSADREIAVGGEVIARGRVYMDAQIGVIEEINGRGATLGGLPRSLIDLLWRGHPGVRWAIADVTERNAVSGPHAASA